MDHRTDIRALNAKELDRLHQAARQEAERLRRQAIDDFWRGSNALLSDTMTGARRSAQRLAARLTRHEQLRGAPCER